MDKGSLGWINSAALSKKLLNILSKMNSWDVSEPIISVDKILFLKLNEVRKISNRNDLDLNKLKKTIVQKKKMKC